MLASSSVYRRALLERFGLPFKVVPPGTNEAHVAGELPPDRAIRVALEKAHAVATQHPDAVVVASDQVAAMGSIVLDKPGTADKCRAQLRALSGSSARFHTSCVVIAPDGERWAHLDTTTVTFRTLSPVEIERYVAREQPVDCAGGFKAEALGITLFASIDSQDPTALIGLPLIWLAGALRQSGFSLP